MNNLLFSISGKIGILTSIFAGFMIIAIASCDSKPPKNSKVAQTQRGRLLFQNYCVDCHGHLGQGLRIKDLDPAPANLTQIMRRRGVKEFPILEIADIIDGRNMQKEHGTRAMPIWGEVFSNDENLDEKEIKGKKGELIAYLMSIQE